MFLQIHTLVSYPASLLNRDEAGLAKRIPFGNAIRLRVSSQCLKRHWREALTERLPDIPDGYRTRNFFTGVVCNAAIRKGIDKELAEELTRILIERFKESKKKKNISETEEKSDKNHDTDQENNKNKNKSKNSESKYDTEQPVLFGLREAEYFTQMLLEASQQKDPVEALKKRLKSSDEKANLKAMSKSAAGLTAVLFGRMVTSDLFARVDGAVHVAHAMTVHAANTELDYFTVVDDLSCDEETGASHINQTELGAGLYYGHVVVDVPLLVSNLTGCETKDWKSEDATLARRVLEQLVEVITQKSPGAKKGSTAPYPWADLLLLEAGKTQPRTLANAFLDAVPWKNAREDLRITAMRRLADYIQRVDEMYRVTQEYRGLSTTLDSVPSWLPPKVSVPDNINAALNFIWA